MVLILKNTEIQKSSMDACFELSSFKIKLNANLCYDFLKQILGCLNGGTVVDACYYLPMVVISY